MRGTRSSTPRSIFDNYRIVARKICNARFLSLLPKRSECSQKDNSCGGLSDKLELKSKHAASCASDFVRLNKRWN